MEKLGEIVPVPGYSDERITIFLASELRAAKQRLDRDEQLTVHEVSIREAHRMVRDGRIVDGKTIAGLFFLSLKGQD